MKKFLTFLLLLVMCLGLLPGLPANEVAAENDTGILYLAMIKDPEEQFADCYFAEDSRMIAEDIQISITNKDTGETFPLNLEKHVYHGFEMELPAGEYELSVGNPGDYLVNGFYKKDPKHPYDAWIAMPDMSFTIQGDYFPPKHYYGLHVGFKEEHIVSFKHNDDENTYESFHADPTGHLRNFPTKTEKAGYSFVGWYWDREAAQNAQVTDDNYITTAELRDFVFTRPEDAAEGETVFYWTFYGGWAKGDVKTHHVTFDLNYDGAPEATVVEVNDGQPVARPEDPVREGYTFLGWYLEGADNPYDFSQPVTQDLKLIAKWEEAETPVTPKHQVTFDLGYEGAPAPTIVEVEDGQPVAKPEDPVRAGYTFLGWFLDGADKPYDFQKPVTQDLTLKAQWQEVVTHQVTFDLNYDGAPAPTIVNVEEGKPVTQPEDPVRAGYTFLGWYLEGEEESYDFSQPVTQDLTLQAQWGEVMTEFVYEMTDDAASATLTLSEVEVNDKPLAEYLAAHYEGGKVMFIVKEYETFEQYPGHPVLQESDRIHLKDRQNYYYDISLVLRQGGQEILLDKDITKATLTFALHSDKKFKDPEVYTNYTIPGATAYLLEAVENVTLEGHQVVAVMPHFSHCILSLAEDTSTPEEETEPEEEETEPHEDTETGEATRPDTDKKPAETPVKPKAPMPMGWHKRYSGYRLPGAKAAQAAKQPAPEAKVDSARAQGTVTTTLPATGETRVAMPYILLLLGAALVLTVIRKKK